MLQTGISFFLILCATEKSKFVSDVVIRKAVYAIIILYRTNPKLLQILQFMEAASAISMYLHVLAITLPCGYTTTVPSRKYAHPFLQEV